jgi:flagellar biosynthesis/type III secretory pathway ATPase
VSTDESWLAVQIDEVLDRVAEEEWLEQVRRTQCEVAALLTRGEEIKALRRHGRLGKEARAELQSIAERVKELSELLMQSLPEEQRREWQEKFLWL